ncbi:MAG: hypothetical protein AAGG80_00360, partial [Pseudomonadota bacterium]
IYEIVSFFIQSILGADLDSGHFLPSMAKNSGMTRTNWLFFDLRNNAFEKRGGWLCIDLRNNAFGKRGRWFYDELRNNAFGKGGDDSGMNYTTTPLKKGRE